LRFLTAPQTREALPMRDAIAAMERAFGPDTEVPQRQLVGNSFFMAARVGEHAGVKVVSTVPGNPVGVVAVFDSEGVPVGFVDGPTITTIRTGAVAGLATDLLAPRDASTLAMIGAGTLALDQIAAIREVRHITDVFVWSRDPVNAEQLADQVGGSVSLSPTEAVCDADIVATATPSQTALFEASALQPLVHINAMGAYTPTMMEVPSDFVRSAFVVVEDLQAAEREAGDLIQAGQQPHATMSEMLNATVACTHERTLFKSVGVATMDVAAAVQALKNAASMGLGTVLDT